MVTTQPRIPINTCRSGDLSKALTWGCACCAQFKRAFKRNDKPICLAVVKFIAHLTNQQVVFELLALQIMMLLLENPSGAQASKGLSVTLTVLEYPTLAARQRAGAAAQTSSSDMHSGAPVAGLCCRVYC